MLYSNWGIKFCSPAPNPCCSWSRLCRNVLLRAAKWLGFLKHLRNIFCVTDRQTLHFNYTVIPFLPLVKLWYVTAMLTPLLQLWICVHFIHGLSMLSLSAKSSVSSCFDVSEATFALIHFVKGSHTDALCPHTKQYASLCKPCGCYLKKLENKRETQ